MLHSEVDETFTTGGNQIDACPRLNDQQNSSLILHVRSADARSRPRQKQKSLTLGRVYHVLNCLRHFIGEELNVNPQSPEAPDRDRFVLSKGHGAPVLFQVLAERGFFPIERLKEFGKPGSLFHEHPPKPGYIPGVEAATGSLGHGLPMALGMAIAQRIQGRTTAATHCWVTVSATRAASGKLPCLLQDRTWII